MVYKAHSTYYLDLSQKSSPTSGLKHLFSYFGYKSLYTPWIITTIYIFIGNIYPISYSVLPYRLTFVTFCYNFFKILLIKPSLFTFKNTLLSSQCVFLLTGCIIGTSVLSYLKISYG